MLNSIQEVDTHTCAASKDTIEAASYLDSAVAESDVDSPNPLTRQRLVCGQDGDDSPTVVSESGSTNNSPFDYPLAAASASNATPRAATGQSSNTISIPTHFLAQRDPWTNSGWTKLHVRELVTSVLSWDGIPLCVVNKGHFLADFDTGAAQYCSSTLVNGLLAIATRLEENNHHHHHQDTTHRGRGVPSSYDFIREARACSLDKDYVSALANIQALGVLALYQTSFGQIVETQKLVDDYAAATASLYLSKSTAAPGNDYDRVCEETYHGAISLQRYVMFAHSSTSILVF